MCAPSRGWFLIGLAALLVIAAAAALFVAWREVQNEKVLHPETGFKFPEIRQIKRIRVSKFVAVATEGPVDTDVSEVHWQDILSALNPSESDPKPLLWEVMGELEIQTAGDVSIFIALFHTGSRELGAFAAGNKERRSRAYFRGGNSVQLRGVLVNAVSAAPPGGK